MLKSVLIDVDYEYKTSSISAYRFDSTNSINIIQLKYLEIETKSKNIVTSMPEKKLVLDAFFNTELFCFQSISLAI